MFYTSPNVFASKPCTLGDIRGNLGTCLWKSAPVGHYRTSKIRALGARFEGLATSLVLATGLGFFSTSFGTLATILRALSAGFGSRQIGFCLLALSVGALAANDGTFSPSVGIVATTNFRDLGRGVGEFPVGERAFGKIQKCLETIQRDLGTIFGGLGASTVATGPARCFVIDFSLASQNILTAVLSKLTDY